LTSPRITVAETYPAEVYGHLGLSKKFGKNNREGRASQAHAILTWYKNEAIVFDADLVADIEDGLGNAETGEDAFDACIGLLGMIEAVRDPSQCLVPQDPVVRNIEGWILGVNPLGLKPTSGTPRHSATSQAMKELQQATPTSNIPAHEGRGRWCPACHQKWFRCWPLGWDGHAAHVCTGITGDTPENRKRAYRERYLV
jgi:hypothetical protein